MYRVGTHARSHMRVRVWPLPLLLCLLAFTQTARAFSLARSTSRRERALTPHCRRVSLALRISSECTVDVCAEITAAAPPDQQRFPVSCEVTGSAESYVIVSLPTGCRCLPALSGCGRREQGDTLQSPAASACAEAGKANTRIRSKSCSWRDLRLVS